MKRAGFQKMKCVTINGLQIRFYILLGGSSSRSISSGKCYAYAWFHALAHGLPRLPALPTIRLNRCEPHTWLLTLFPLGRTATAAKGLNFDPSDGAGRVTFVPGGGTVLIRATETLLLLVQILKKAPRYPRSVLRGYQDLKFGARMRQAPSGVIDLFAPQVLLLTGWNSGTALSSQWQITSK
jgi:hypothetical protein